MHAPANSQKQEASTEWNDDDAKAVLQVLQAKGDYYAVLLASHTMSDNELRLQYHKQSLSCHPDRNHHPQATQAMQLVIEAWAFLQHPASKQLYDKRAEQTQNTQKRGQAARTEKRFHGGDERSQAVAEKQSAKSWTMETRRQYLEASGHRRNPNRFSKNVRPST